MSTPKARTFFARDGLLSRAYPGYEFRPGQLRMAQEVEAALRDRQHLLVEAGTGTGKTLAYLIPAILAGKRIIISTGTKTLQEQLFHKDIPFLQTLFTDALSVCYMKGRANYLCRQKLYDAEREPVLSGIAEVREYAVIRDWDLRTDTGDRSELHEIADGSTTWTKLDARGDLCAGQKCKQFERCFITAMQRRARESQIVIVNHHLFFADLALRDQPFAGILPEYSAVIFDEAHEIEDVAGQYFGRAISNLQLQDLIRDTAAISRRKLFSSPELDRSLVHLGDVSEHFFALFPGEGRQGFRHQKAFLDAHEMTYRELLLALDLFAGRLELVTGATEDTVPLVRRAIAAGQTLRFWMEPADQKGFVYWVERRGRGVFLQCTPIDVAPMLREHLATRIESVVLTSATLTVSGSFDYAQKRLGLENARTLQVESPFDYGEQALLYVPQQLPEPRSAQFTQRASEEVERILAASRGRAFVLFTSYAQMRQVFELLRDKLEHPVLLQGEAPRARLIEMFRSTPGCVLFATSSFWQGVDVQGEQLSCVIIDRLPFAVPSDPVVSARVDAIQQSGGNAFYEYQVPQAALTLKQGFGRLLRSASDRGVLVLLDNRISKQRYGQVFFASLPPYRTTTRIEDVEAFFSV